MQARYNRDIIKQKERVQARLCGAMCVAIVALTILGVFYAF